MLLHFETFKNTNPDKSYHLPNLGILSLTISRKALGHEVREAAGSPLQGAGSAPGAGSPLQGAGSPLQGAGSAVPA